jgi:hypothetical protein
MKFLIKIILFSLMALLVSCASGRIDNRRISGTACAPMQDAKTGEQICRRMDAHEDPTRFHKLRPWESYPDIPELNEMN